jgi:hypothetical protein
MPPRVHAVGLVQRVPERHSLNGLLTLSATEMHAIVPLMRSPPDELSEERLLAALSEAMISSIKEIAPTTSSIFWSASTPRQEKRNKIKSCCESQEASASYKHGPCSTLVAHTTRM